VTLEACRAVIDYAFREMKTGRLINAVDGNNKPSIDLMSRLGFSIQPNLSPAYPGGVVGVLKNTLLTPVTPDGAP
jgi:hypothetical protein